MHGKQRRARTLLRRRTFSSLVVGLARFENFESCQCPRGSNIVLDYVRISDTRTLLACSRCKGIVGMLDDILSLSKKFERVRPPRLDWTSDELIALR